MTLMLCVPLCPLTLFWKVVSFDVLLSAAHAHVMQHCLLMTKHSKLEENGALVSCFSLLALVQTTIRDEDNCLDTLLMVNRIS